MSKNSAKKQESIDFAVGGQALIEGVMMRSPNYVVVSVRRPDGTIELKKDYYQNLSRRIKILSLPIVRGVSNFFEMMVIGTKALNFSAKISLADDGQEHAKIAKEASGKHDSLPVIHQTNQKKSEKAATKKETTSGSKSEKFSNFENISLGVSIIFALAMSIFMFKFLPLWFTDFLSHQFKVINQNYLLYNFIDGLTKTTFFIVYIWTLSKLPDIHRVFQYHGAEHKSIMTYEQGLPLTVENARTQTRFHPRCGTSFIIVVFLLSIFIYTFVPRSPDFFMNFGLRVLFLPLIAGVSYEFLKWTAKQSMDNKFINFLTKPGLLMQRITTQEPDDAMLEVALNSLTIALDAEKQHHQVA